MQKQLLLGGKKFQVTIDRLCHQLIENHDDFKDAVLIGMQPRGIYLAKRIKHDLQQILGVTDVPCGELDVTFFRDDFRRKGNPLLPNKTKIEFIIEDKNVVLIDDVLYTGRTVRAGLDAMLAFGRPRKVELMCLVDRRYSRHLPIEPDYIGIEVDTISSEKVKVTWQGVEEQDAVWLIDKQEE
ncbi:MAG: pyrimidine operon attenuation protein/uracil phosphoribosyltransferase [Sphingobacteriales bacterium]|jgi:pyrimidine operon attenuation protein/uracil phosphoribosyltransferase